MSRFQYTARNASGEQVKGSIEAPSRKHAIKLIHLRSLTPVLIQDSAAGSSGSKPAKAAKAVNGKKHEKAPERETSSVSVSTNTSRLSSAHRLPFLRSLSELVTSGMPVGDAIRLLSIRIKDKSLKKIAVFLWENVSAGQSVSEAMAQLPHVFDRSTIHLVQAGEATGSLKEILHRLVHYFEERKELQNKVNTALAYPIFILCVAVGVLFFALFYLFPRMETLFTSLGGTLPLSTQILIGSADFLLTYGIFFLVAIILFGIGIWQWAQTEKGRMKLDEWILRVPILGKFFLINDILGVSQTLSALMENGITTTEALRMTENVIQNHHFRESFSGARLMVTEGTSISGALQTTGYMPDLVLDMLEVGENTGNIVSSLKEITRLYQKRIAQQLQLFTSILSIGVLLFAVVFVGFIALAIFTAVFQLSGSF
ncbi:MAG: type II secretion system F family protein [Opitutales bacterium]